MYNVTITFKIQEYLTNEQINQVGKALQEYISEEMPHVEISGDFRDMKVTLHDPNVCIQLHTKPLFSTVKPEQT